MNPALSLELVVISPRRLLTHGVERFSQLSVSTQSRTIPLHPGHASQHSRRPGVPRLDLYLNELF